MMDKLVNRSTKVGNFDIHYRAGGQGEPLIIIHGGANGSEAWMDSASELSKSYTVYLPDMPGFGLSQSLVGGYYLPDLVEFVDNFADTLGLESFCLLGHSLGGAIALNYAVRFPNKVKKLVLVSSMCLGREIAWWIRLLSQPAFAESIGIMVISVLKGIKWIADKFFPGFRLVLPFSITSISIGVAMTTLKGQTKVLIDHLSEIMAPTLVVWGDEDSIVPVTQAYAAAQLIPCCEVRVFEGCGHSVHSQKAREFSQLLTRFLG